MLKTAARILLLRVLPRRLLPIVTVVEALMLIRSVRKRSRKPDEVVRVNPPTESRTAPPSSAAATSTSPPSRARRAPRVGRPTVGRG
jgi:hypothetical protein